MTYGIYDALLTLCLQNFNEEDIWNILMCLVIYETMFEFKFLSRELIGGWDEKPFQNAAQQLFCLLHCSGRTDKVSVKVSNWWSTATPLTAYHRLFSLQEGSCVWVSRGLGGVLKWKPPRNALIFEFAPFSHERFNEAFWLVRNSSQITKVSMKIITMDARNGGNYIFEL